MKKINQFLNEGVEYSEDDYRSFRDNGSGSYEKYITKHPEFDNPEFKLYVIQHNKADCDSGELADISLQEIERLATEFRRE